MSADARISSAEKLPLEIRVNGSPRASVNTASGDRHRIEAFGSVSRQHGGQCCSVTRGRRAWFALQAGGNLISPEPRRTRALKART